MKLSELIEDLTKLQKRFGSDTKVLVARDEEGNGFLEVAGAWDYQATEEVGEISLVHPDDQPDFHKDELETVIVVWP